MRIAVDCDLTVVDTAHHWWEWLNKVTLSDNPYPLFEDGVVDYDLTKYYKKELDAIGIDGYEFWRSSTLYDTLVPIDGAVEVLQHLHELGHEIIFVSTIKGSHHKSKYYFLKRYFPFMKGFVATKEKHLVGCDVIIDDRNNVLNKFINTLCVKRSTEFTQDTDLPVGAVSFKNWCEVTNIIEEYECKILSKTSMIGMMSQKFLSITQRKLKKED